MNQSIKELIEQVLNLALSSEESTIKKSFQVKVMKKGFYFTPHLPTELIMDDTLYYRIFDIVFFAVYPKFTMIRPNSIQIVATSEKPVETSTSFFFPWKVGVSKRLIGSLEQVMSTDKNRIDLMDGISFDFNKASNLCISGNVGSGKSVGLRYLLENYSRLGHVILIDPKKSDGARWAKSHPEVDLIIPDEGDRPEDFLPRVTAALAKGTEEIAKRQEALYKNSSKVSTDYRELGFEPLFIVIDEVASLAVGSKKTLLNDFHMLLTQLCLLGRESGVICCLSMQEARAEVLPVQVRSQMGVRILLGRVDSKSVAFLFPELEKGLPLPVGGKGTGIVSINDGEHYGIEPIAMPTIKNEEVSK